MRDLTNSQDKPTEGCPVKTNIGTKYPINSKRIDQYSQNLSILDHIENISIVAKIFFPMKMSSIQQY